MMSAVMIVVDPVGVDAVDLHEGGSEVIPLVDNLTRRKAANLD